MKFKDKKQGKKETEKKANEKRKKEKEETDKMESEKQEQESRTIVTHSLRGCLERCQQWVGHYA